MDHFPKTEWIDHPPLIFSTSRIDEKPKWTVSHVYRFELTRRHAGRPNIAFLDGHVEHGSLRDWTLPMESVHRRWHYNGKVHLKRLYYRDAENWALLRGMDEEIVE